MRSAVALVLVAGLATNVLAAPAPPDSVTYRVDGLITSRPFHGLRYEDARALGPEAIPILRARLHDPNYEGFRSDICSAICMIGAPEGYPILRAFIWDRGKNLYPNLGEPRPCIAPMVAQSGMGLIAKNSDDALKYLMQGTNPAYWDSLPWHCSDGGNTRRLMVNHSIIALTYTERVEARAHLVKISDSGQSEEVRSRAQRAVARFDEIKKLGYAEYVRQDRKNRGY
jgi:hypothetical protein